MSLAFFCLGAASLALFAVERREIHTRAGRFGTWGLLTIGVAYFCAGIFPPDPKWFVSSLLHGIGGLVVIFGSPMVFMLVSKGLVRNEASATAARPLIWTATLTWLSLAFFYASIVGFRGTPRFGSIVVGWTNRILITTFALWLRRSSGPWGDALMATARAHFTKKAASRILFALSFVFRGDRQRPRTRLP